MPAALLWARGARDWRVGGSTRGTSSAGEGPKLTVVPGVKPPPDIVTQLPPSNGPSAGETEASWAEPGTQSYSTRCRSSIPASTIDPASRSEATKRTLTWLVGTMESASRIVSRIQPPIASGPVGPIVLATTQVDPPSLERSTRRVSVPGAGPVMFVYQRQYERCGSTMAEASRSGERSVVRPPSTSASLCGPPADPWPVTQHMLPGSRV